MLDRVRDVGDTFTDLRNPELSLPNHHAPLHPLQETKLGQRAGIALLGGHVLRGLHPREHAPSHGRRLVLHQQLLLLLRQAARLRQADGLHFVLHARLAAAHHSRALQDRHPLGSAETTQDFITAPRWHVLQRAGHLDLHF